MSEVPARKRPIRVVRQLDHDAVDARLDASLLDYGRLSREAGISAEDAVNRLRSLLDDDIEPGAGSRRGWRPPPIPLRVLAWVGGGLLAAIIGWASLTAVTGDHNQLPPTAEAAPSTSALVEVPPVGVPGFAEMYVAVYLGQAGEGTEHLLEPYLDEPVQLPGLSPGRRYVQNLATVGIEPAPDGWVVSVAAQTLRRVDGGYGESTVEYYRVTVRESGGWFTDALPMPVAGF